MKSTILFVSGASALQIGTHLTTTKCRCPSATMVDDKVHFFTAAATTVSAHSPPLSHPCVVVCLQAEVEEYFNNDGFDRWSRIYSEDGEVNSVQLDIRNGHGVTVDKVLKWVDADGTAAAGQSFCDAGCGVGSLSLPLAKRGATVTASDISAAMVEEATKRAASAGLSDKATFSTSDLENIEGKYDTVTCIDVMIHYPEEKMAQMVSGLADKAEKRLIISFAPNTWCAPAASRLVLAACPPRVLAAAPARRPLPVGLTRRPSRRYYTALKKFGELFPGPSKTTRAYLHTEEAVLKASETIRDSPRPDAALKSESSLGQLCHTPYTRPPAATRGPEQP